MNDCVSASDCGSGSKLMLGLAEWFGKVEAADPWETKVALTAIGSIWLAR
jgi:hypothetical protein